MNLNFREETTGTKQRQRPLQLGSLRNATMKEKEEELALFLEMRRKEKDHHNLLLQNSDEFDAPIGQSNGSSQIFNISSTAQRKTATDEFLNSDNDKNDYDWLMTPPGTPLFSSLESESQRTVMNQLETSKARPLMLKSRLASHQTDHVAKSNISAKQPALSPGLTNSSSRLHKPASPTGRPNLSTSSKSTKPIITTVNGSKPSLITVNKPTRSGTPNSRPTLAVVPRSSTPTTRSTSTPTARTSVPASKATSRAATPTRKPTNPVVAPPVTRPPSSSSTTKNPPPPPRSSSPTVKPRAVKPSDIPGFGLDAPSNLRTSLPNRPISATRGRPGIPSGRTTSVEPPLSNPRVRRQSCSPSRGRPPNAVNLHSNGSSVPALNRLHAKANDNISPVMIGTKMVDRVMNMRKLAPPKQDDKHSPLGNLSGKSSSPDSSGFGRTLSKKSLDMAIRHMDILRTIPSNLRPLMTNVPASSVYSVRSAGPTRSRRTVVSVSDSPLATSSNASSDFSVNNNTSICVDGEIYEDFSSDNKDIIKSPASLRGMAGKVAYVGPG